MSSGIRDPLLAALLDRLHAASSRAEAALAAGFGHWAHWRAPDWSRFDAFLWDERAALGRDKAALCHLLCRALRARRVVEAGTSLGLSTLYLAAAVCENVGPDGEGVVIGTEHEPGKVAAARAHFEEAGLARFVDLREGDLRDTLRDVGGPVDFVLIDVWAPMARPALELVAPQLRPGAIVACDDATQFRDAYADYFAFVRDPANRFDTLTLPFEGGLALSLRT